MVYYYKIKLKILIVLLIVTSLLGYLLWGGGNHAFLFQAEWEVLSQLFTHPRAVLHPFTLLPLISQWLLVWALFQPKPHKGLVYVSIAGLGLLLGFMFLIGCISMNINIIISCIPFLLVAALTLFYLKIKNKEGINI